VLLVAADGYILDVHGPYFADSRNNDANILRCQYDRDQELRNWLQPGDVVIVDRGYRDARQFLNNIGISVQMPPALGGRRQLPTAEANAGRIVTKQRWVVEARNGHVQSIFKIFRNTFLIAQISNLGEFFRIACAIINRYHPVLHMEEANEELAQEMLQMVNEPNLVQARAENEVLLRRHGRWAPLEQNQLENFPVLNIAQLRHLTFGTFQVKLSPSYIQDNNHAPTG